MVTPIDDVGELVGELFPLSRQERELRLSEGDISLPLIRRVRSLLDTLDSTTSSGFMEKPISPRAIHEFVKQVREDFEGRPTGDAEASGPTAELPAETIGGHRLLALVGEGGMGRVYRAEQRDPRRMVAIKVIRPERLTPARLARFEIEKQALSRLQHPGIAQIYEADTASLGSSSVPYFVMEYVEGTTLKEFCQPLSLEQRLPVLARVCEAAEHAHQRSVVHRDLKPDNILVTNDGQPKVLDFGVARTMEPTVDEGLTQEGELVGTIRYMSPEQLSAGRIDARCDVYSLGVIVFEILHGAHPHSEVPSDDVAKLIHSVAHTDPPRLATVEPAMRGDLDAIVGKAMALRPADRYRSAGELRADLLRFLDRRPIQARSNSRFYKCRRLLRHRWKLFTACGIALVGLTLALGSYWGVGSGTKDDLPPLPTRVSLNSEKRALTLWSRDGSPLHEWDSKEQRGIHRYFAMDQRESPLVAIWFTSQARHKFAGQLAAYSWANPKSAIWSTGQMELVTPPLPKDHTGTPWKIKRVERVDCMKEYPGDEFVVIQRWGSYSQVSIRVLDALGNIRYQLWHDGDVLDICWDEAFNRFYVTGYCEATWASVGLDLGAQQYPAVVFSFEPRPGHLGTQWAVLDRDVRDTSVLWYRWLGPAIQLPRSAPTKPLFQPFDPTATDSGGRMRLEFYFGTNAPGNPTLFIALDHEGREIRQLRDVGDTYRSRLGRGDLPDPEHFELLEYADLPTKEN